MRMILVIMLMCHSLFAFTLEEVEQRAKDFNIDIAIEKNVLQSSKQNFDAQKLKRYGEVELFSTYTKYDSKRTLKPLSPPISSNIATSKDIANVGVSYSVVLFNGFSDTRDINVANIQNELQISMITLTTNQVLYHVRSIYLDILSLKNQKNAQMQYRKSLERLKQNISQEISLGKRAKVDLFKVEADLQSTISEIGQMQSNINILKSSLGVLMNYEDDFDVVDNIPFKDKELIDSKSYFKNIENTSYYKLSKFNQEKSSNEYEKSKASYYPKVLANTQYTKVYSADGDEDSMWQAGLCLNWKIFDFTRTNKLVQKAKINQIKSSLELEKTKLELKQKIIAALNTIQLNKEAYIRAQKELSFSQQTVKIEKIRYEQEAIDIYNYLDANGKNEIVKAKQISAKYNLIKSYYYFEYILEESK
ncbi:MAG: outer membrane protein [Sulfurimonas sp.]|jgi:outer membrane protein